MNAAKNILLAGSSTTRPAPLCRKRPDLVPPYLGLDSSSCFVCYYLLCRKRPTDTDIDLPVKKRCHHRTNNLAVDAARSSSDPAFSNPGKMRLRHLMPVSEFESPLKDQE